MRKLIFISIFYAGLCHGQNKNYYDLLDRTESERMEPRPAINSDLEIIEFDKQDYAGLIVDQFNSSRKRKGRTDFGLDSAFQQVCNTGVKHFSSTFFKSRKSASKVLRYTEFGIRYLNGENRLFKVYTLSYNLTNLSTLRPFFYHSQDQQTSLKLYYGKRPKTLNPDHPDYEEPKPVAPITEIEFARGVEDHIRNQDGVIEFFSKSYTYLGVAVRLDEYTINRRKIPHAFIMVIIGGKQTQNVRLVKPVEPESDKDDPLLILK